MAKATEIIITDKCVRGLKCPFTGQELKVVGHIGGGHIVYNAPEAFSLSEPQASVERLYARATMRNGVEGAVSREEAMIDPYTKNRFELKQLPDGRFQFRGGFDPRMGRMSLAEFVTLASCGKRRMTPPPEATSVEHIEEEVPTEADDSNDPHKAVEEMSEKAAHDIAKAAGLDHGKVAVSMTAPAKPKAKRKN